MMKKHTLILASLATLILTSAIFMSCKSKKAGANEPNGKSVESVSQKPEVKPVLLDTTHYGRDAFDASNIRVNGDTLFIDAEYSGGCKEHTFTARHHGNYMKSMPPQLNLYVDHEANGDRCRELIKRTIAFDLKSCKVGKSGTLILLINADRSKKVTYTY
jgi:hypothetical protein